MNIVALLVAAGLVTGVSAKVWAGSGCGASAEGGKPVCASGAAEAASKEAEHAYGKVDTKALKSLLDAKVPVVLVDARSGKWDDGKRIPGAITLASDSADDAIASALPSKDTLVVAYCSNLKCPASAILADKLVALGYKNVLKYPEGIAAWIEAGNAVTETPKPNS